MGLDRDAWRSTGQDDYVEVNQRALIDKVLARYSGEFTVFRELLQNSDDAHAPEVKIYFETAEYLKRVGQAKKGNVKQPLPDLRSTPVSQWTFKNNGFTFRGEDWTRLRRIADGNPDEGKIGAFGVGFYSLFSVTDSPLVISGGQAMEFYWKDNKDQLSIRRGAVPSKGPVDPWTTFEICLREAGPIPQAFGLLRFLASSITFMEHLSEVSVYFDEHRIGHIKKTHGVPTAIPFPIQLKPFSGSELMSVTAVQSRTIMIGAEIMHAVYGTAKSLQSEGLERRKPKGLTELHKTSVTLTAFTAEVDAHVNDKLTSEFLRSTKKKPPTQLKYHLIYTGKEDYERSLADDKNQPATGGCVFQGLRADLSGATHTRVYIGHATGQSTGVGGHMASYFIPTVERESIDFVDKNMTVWNEELLYVGGLLARVAYESQLSAIHNAWIGATKGVPDSRPPQELQYRLQEEFIHVLRFFEFHRSTPSERVGQLLEASFYGCSSASPRMLSSVGVREASAIKEYHPGLARFLKNMPMFPQRVISECVRAIQILKDKEILSPVTFPDVLQYLRQRPLNKEEVVSCLQWWMHLTEQDWSSDDTVQLLDVVVFRDVHGANLLLSSVRCFADPQALGSHIPPNSPLPPSLLPHDIAKHFHPMVLVAFGWCEFTIVDWLRYVSREEFVYKSPAHDFTTSPDWTLCVLGALARLWSSASNDARNTVKEVFTTRKCILTTHGLRMPKESYLLGTNTGLFSNLQLPMVQFPGGLKISEETETVLLFIGVRKHVDPQLILTRMTETNMWDIAGLIRYLCEVRKSLSRDELTKLASSAIFTEEGNSDPTRRCLARDLYAPTDTFRRLRLRVIRWEEKSIWSDGSDEAKLLFQLGLRPYPSLEEIVRLCSSKDDAVRAAAFQYLCENLHSKYSSYDPRNFEHVAFIPAENNHGNRLGKLGDVFLDKKWKALGFFVVPDDNQDAPISELGILDHPPTSKLLSHLTKAKPQDETAAQEWFEILSGHVSGFDSHELVNLSKLPIVPTKQIRDWSTPAQCYLGEGARDPLYSKLFVFVDFGPAANRFLTACGARNEPTVADVSQSLVDDPAHFYDAADGPENFLTQLRNLAVNKHRIPNMTLGKMKFGPVLLGKKNMGAIQAWNHYNHERQSPKKIVIADDINAYRLFREDILVAPQEELLEEFYVSLGCKRLSDVVQEQCKVVGNVTDHETVKRCLEIRILVLQRLAIFLHEFTYAKPKASSEWLSKAGNFVVKACDSLSIYKTLEIGDQKIEKPQKTSAGAKKDNQGHIELWLSRDALKEPDMYEISTSLCRLLFGTAKVSESLLFSMILSTDLEALGRRGCNVDMILKRCHIEQDGPDEIKGDDIAKEQQSSSLEVDCSSQENQNWTTKPEEQIPTTPITPAGQDPPQPGELSRRITAAEIPTSSTPKPSDSVLSAGGCTSVVEATMRSPACKGSHVAHPSSSCVSLSEGSETPHHPATPSAHPPCGLESGSHTGRSRSMLHRMFHRKQCAPTPGTAVTPPELAVRVEQHATPQDEIRDKIDKAIKACNPGEVQLRRDFNDAEAGNKSSNDHYCHDVSAKTSKLKHVGEVRVAASRSAAKGDPVTVQVFATEDFPRHKKFMTIKEEPLKHFAEIVVPIAEAYDLPTTSLNIFYDEKGSSIAFNRNGGLFLNLRYFEVWHDEDVANGDKRQAQTSWFFTLAHEIAHNMIKSHNSDHAYWFSKICEEHLKYLQQILQVGTTVRTLPV